MEHLSRAAQQRLKASFFCSSCLRRTIKLLSHRRASSTPCLRPLHTSRLLCAPQTKDFQAQALGDFYTDLLAKPLAKPTIQSKTPDLPTFVPRSSDETKEQRAAKLFGNIHGSGYERHTYNKPDATWQTINGVPIPPRPGEPDNCCMSGCVHCVWDDFRDDVETWAIRLREAQAKIQGAGMEGPPKAGMHRTEVADAASSMDDDGGGSQGLWDSPSVPGVEGEDLFRGIPIGIREFMATEKRIRDRKMERKERRKHA